MGYTKPCSHHSHPLPSIPPHSHALPPTLTYIHPLPSTPTHSTHFYSLLHTPTHSQHTPVNFHSFLAHIHSFLADSYSFPLMFSPLLLILNSVPPMRSLSHPFPVHSPHSLTQSSPSPTIPTHV